MNEQAKEQAELIPESLQKMVYEHLKEKFEKPKPTEKPTPEEIGAITDSIMQ